MSSEKGLIRVSPAVCRVEKTGSMLVSGKMYLSEALAATVDLMAIEQVRNMAALPGIISESIAMPDVHIGYGFPIGGVAAFYADTGIISPGGIGFDINCGVRLLVTDVSEARVREFIEELIGLLGKAVPTGSGHESSVKLSHEELDKVLTEGSRWALAHGYATKEDLARTEESGAMPGADANAVSHRAKDRGVNQLGTLGAGNHFLEIQTVEKILDPVRAAALGLHAGQVCIMIHCGSRGVGHQICTDYLRLMEDEYPDIAKSIPEKNLLYAPAASRLGKLYFGAMAAAANYAWCNRQLITHHVRSVFARLFHGSSVRTIYDVSHNIAKLEKHTIMGRERELLVHRKGATRSFGPGRVEIPEEYRALGQPVLIPGSMGTSSYVLCGLKGAMTESFGSCCHGAGRALSRTRALETFKGADVRRELRSHGIHVQGPAQGLAEEAPQAYKDVDEVIRVVAQAGLAVPVARLKPIGVLKG